MKWLCGHLAILIVPAIVSYILSKFPPTSVLHPPNVLASALDRAHVEEEVRRRASRDSLTGLANRAFLDVHLNHSLAAAARNGGRVALLLLDLDRFKVVNDTLGHSAGDELLRVVAERLTESVRGGDVVARLAGMSSWSCARAPAPWSVSPPSPSG